MKRIIQIGMFAVIIGALLIPVAALADHHAVKVAEKAGIGNT